MAHTMFSTWRWDTGETGPAPERGAAASPTAVCRPGVVPGPGRNRAPRAGAVAGPLAGTHLPRMEVGLCRQHAHHVGSQLGAAGMRRSHALDGGEEDAQPFRGLEVFHKHLWEEGGEGQHVSHPEGCDGPAQPCCSQRPRRAGSRGWAGRRWGCGSRGDRATAGTTPVLFLTSQGRGLLRGSGLALLTMKIVLVLLSCESRRDSRARQRSWSCGCSSSCCHSLVPGEEQRRCQRGGLGTWEWQPGARAEASLAGRGHARAEPGARLPRRARDRALRAGGTARRPAERQPGSVGFLLLRRGAQAARRWPGCAGVPVCGGTQPDAAPLTSLLPDEDVEVTDSLRCLVAFSLVLGGAAQEEVPHQPPQHGEAVLLGVMVPERCGSCKAGARLGREAARDHG